MKALVDSLVYFPDRELYGDPADVSLAFTDLSIPTEDGETLHGWWIPARATPSRGHVVFFHGNAGNVSHRLAHAQALTAAGLDLLLVDYRGYGRSSGRPSEEGLHLDARAARAALLAGGQVDPSRLVYMGESLGGAVALRLALEAPPLALVLQSTFTSLRDVARAHYPPPLPALAGDAYPNLKRIAYLRARLLVVHGERDDIVPVVTTRRMIDQLRENGGNPKYSELPGVGHNSWTPAYDPKFGLLDWMFEQRR